MNISNRNRATLVGILILLAYSMLTYPFTDKIILGVITDILSGLAVITIPLLLFPVFNSKENKTLNTAYLISRLVEGILMIIGGIFILFPSLEPYRETLYSRIHIFFFISGALFFYILFLRTQIIPKFISIWGIVATILLFIITIPELLGIKSMLLQALMLPIVLNEIFLAFWLMIRGFRSDLRRKVDSLPDRRITKPPY